MVPRQGADVLAARAAHGLEGVVGQLPFPDYVPPSNSIVPGITLTRKYAGVRII